MRREVQIMHHLKVRGRTRAGARPARRAGARVQYGAAPAEVQRSTLLLLLKQSSS